MKAQSHLTRQVFRALITNKPYRAPGCQLRRTSVPLTPSQHRRSFHSSKRRQLFDFFGDAPKPLEGAKPTPQNVERALTQLTDVVRAKRMRSRPPPDKVVVDALRFLFSARAEKPQDMTKTEVFLITEALHHLTEQDAVLNDHVEETVTKQDLQNLAAALAFYGQGDTFGSDARALAESIFRIIRDRGGHIDSDTFASYVTVLARSGSTQDALALIRKEEDLPRGEAMRLWVAVLKNERRPAVFQKVLNELHQRLGPLTPEAHEDLVAFATSRGNIGLSKELLDYRFQNYEPPTTASLAHILKLCIDKGHRILGAHCAESLQKRNDLGRSSSAVLLLWSLTENDRKKSLKQRMLDLQEQGMGDVVSMQTFNFLIEHAYRNKNPEQAHKLIELAEFFGLRPDGTSYAMALDYDLARDDLNAAVSSFEAFVNEDVPDDRSDVQTLNKFLQKLTFSTKPPQELIMRVVDRVLETGADLEAETIAGLCSVFLKENQPDQLTGLVRYRVDAFSKVDRARIITVFKSFILDPTTSEQIAWNTYDILRNAFPEMEVPDRIQLMQGFFDRNRPEFACLVFGHMRQRQELEARPTAEAYAQCFFGIAKCKDVDGLQMVYNMLKMDQEVDQTTKIHNALMAAYPACRTPFTAIIDHFWKVLDSREGPTLSTFLLALRACETWVPHGSLEARRIMALMQKWDMVITKEIYDTYIGAIAGQSEFENTIELIEHMEEDMGEAPDAITIGVFYNAIPWQYRKDEVERWAKREYPELWNELVSFGDVIDEEWDVRYFKIHREIDTDDELLFGEGEYSPKLGEEARAALEPPRS